MNAHLREARHLLQDRKQFAGDLSQHVATRLSANADTGQTFLVPSCRRAQQLRTTITAPATATARTFHDARWSSSQPVFFPDHTVVRTPAMTAKNLPARKK